MVIFWDFTNRCRSYLYGSLISLPPSKYGTVLSILFIRQLILQYPVAPNAENKKKKLPKRTDCDVSHASCRCSVKQTHMSLLIMKCEARQVQSVS